MFTRHVLLVSALVLTGVLTASARVPPPPPRPALQVSIAIPVHRENRALMVGPNSRFHVVVTNTSKQAQRLWRDWCSWGYYNLSLEQVDANGRAVPIKKGVRVWSKNYPDWFELPPGEHYVIEVQLTDTDWELPAKGSLAPKSSLRAVYQIPEDDQTQERSVWTGRIVSPVQTYTITDNRP
jgi:hypothetical protein